MTWNELMTWKVALVGFAIFGVITFVLLIALAVKK